MAQLEAVYQVEKPIDADPLQISDFIHHVFENQGKYEVKWHPNTVINASDIHKLLEGSGHNVSLNSIDEGIKLFKYEG